ncbi:Palmitoyltransferase zdhhc9 [Clonorchis sinensis]|uniref:protein S-acyltransferase n=1 Tax=Clonorchis sinensis TaxID=79923 RepID=A0A419PHX5_CLOSI|nr:Palmitoyltransferase zdhhc9 [Clonorchis sinensis]
MMYNSPEVTSATICEVRNAVPTPYYRVHMGKNRFCCRGHGVHSRDMSVFYLSLFLIIVVTALFFAFEVRLLTPVLSPALPFFAVVLFLYVLLTFLRTAFTDPGIIPRATEAEAEWIKISIATGEFQVDGMGNFPHNDSANSVVRSYAPGARTRQVLIRDHLMRLNFCHSCRFFRPPRASHCSTCDNCVGFRPMGRLHRSNPQSLPWSRTTIPQVSAANCYPLHRLPGGARHFEPKGIARHIRIELCPCEVRQFSEILIRNHEITFRWRFACSISPVLLNFTVDWITQQPIDEHCGLEDGRMHGPRYSRPSIGPDSVLLPFVLRSRSQKRKSHLPQHLTLWYRLQKHSATRDCSVPTSEVCTMVKVSNQPEDYGLYPSVCHPACFTLCSRDLADVYLGHSQPGDFLPLIGLIITVLGSETVLDAETTASLSCLSTLYPCILSTYLFLLSSILYCILVTFFTILTVFGLSGYHTMLVCRELSTHEDIRHFPRILRQAGHKNPFSRKNGCLNFVYILFGPLQPSLLRGWRIADEQSWPVGARGSLTGPSSVNELLFRPSITNYVVDLDQPLSIPVNIEQTTRPGSDGCAPNNREQTTL